MSHPESAVITGAFSYTGRYVTRRLLGEGVSVRTLTRSTGRESLFGGLVKAYPLDFSDSDGLRRSMEWAGVLYNTYWIRFGRGETTFDQAVENSKLLLSAAADAGVERVVHFSVANASAESRLPYFRGKGQLEELLMQNGLSYTIIRPTLVFGEGDLLINNMAWALRRFPVFPVFGRGDYKVQPIYAEDLAAQAVDAVALRESFVADAAGPETFTSEELLRLLAEAVGSQARLVHRSAQAWLALVAQATQRRTTTYDALGALLLSHPLTLRSDLDPIDDYCNEHGLPPLAVVCVDPKTGEPSRGNVGVFLLDKNRERVFNYDWFTLVPPTPEEIKEAHLAQNPRPSTSAKPREAGTTP